MSVPTKHVRFPDSPVTRAWSPAPIPRTPSPTWSEESFSEPGPSTPPSTTSFPYKQLPLHDSPAKKSIPPTAHPLLAFDMHYGDAPLVWDVICPSSSAHFRITGDVETEMRHRAKGKAPATSPLLAADRTQSATRLPLSQITVRIMQLSCYKPVTIKARLGSEAVTVADLMEGIFEYLRVRVPQKEFKQFPDQMQLEIARWFYTRCDSAGDPQEQKRIRDEGLRRVDCLMGYTQFAGLVPTDDPNTWALYLRPRDTARR